MDQMIRKELAEIKEFMLRQTSLQKEILNFSEAAAYLGISKSSLYKLTSSRAMPVYKPTGKLIFFTRKELDDWLLQNRSASVNEIDAAALKVLKRK